MTGIGPVKIYNGTSIGNALRETLDQFVQSKEISSTLAAGEQLLFF
jgi:hypothetical protein